MLDLDLLSLKDKKCYIIIKNTLMIFYSVINGKGHKMCLDATNV